ncbi:MAG: hypothetical protein LLG02_10125 [Pelosinus sp.]|nr:hypothetical protein [Pelosinus sp.]
MSAICGIVRLDGSPVDCEAGAAMLRDLAIFPADAEGTWTDKTIFLGSHARHITPESVQEKLPYHSKEAGLVITADAIIDNRAELFAALGIASTLQMGMPDSLLILKAYRKWGRECPKYLLGDFAFAIWDERQRQLFCAVDHAGTRTFYYYQGKGFFAFSTLLKPLFEISEVTRKHNDTWIADFLAIPSVLHQLDPELTLYQGISLLPARHSLMVLNNGLKKDVYWQPEALPKLALKKDSEYEEAMREVLGEAVRCRMRSIRPVGVMMSGGLDSTAIAALAAKELAPKGERLKAFSMLPVRGYREYLSKGFIADESQYIEAVRQYIGNIDIKYCRADGRHALSDNGRLMSIVEQPYKIVENIPWLEDIMETAMKAGVGVLLQGAYGNFTISWGDRETYLRSLLADRRWRAVVRETWQTSRCYEHSNRMLLYLLKGLLPSKVQEVLHGLGSQKEGNDLKAMVPINPKFAEQIGMKERFRQFGHDTRHINCLTSVEARLAHLKTAYFSHVGVFNTKETMPYGIIMRDPAIDRRVIEFCLRVPENQFMRNGRDRYLIRRSMKGLLPDKVRFNYNVRGQQGVDMAQRLQPYWTKLVPEIAKIGEREDEQRYLNIAKIKQELQRFPVISGEVTSDVGLRMLVRSLVFSRFLRNEEIFRTGTYGK